ncbi:hypothetical protein EV361DRAFT_676378 [Lentinula raphanica]|nr:hypothetical protein EV361DRAFT_676378 [Lentinula raphanica]
MEPQPTLNHDTNTTQDAMNSNVPIEDVHKGVDMGDWLVAGLSTGEGNNGAVDDVGVNIGPSLFDHPSSPHSGTVTAFRDASRLFSQKPMTSKISTIKPSVFLVEDPLSPANKATQTLILTRSEKISNAHCDDTCTCDICCRKHGETYVPFRGPSKSTTFMPSSHQLIKKVELPPLKIDIEVSLPVVYWGAIYNFSGEIIANGYENLVGNDGVIYAWLLLPNPRIFIGEVQPERELGSQVKFHYLGESQKSSREG